MSLRGSLVGLLIIDVFFLLAIVPVMGLASEAGMFVVMGVYRQYDLARKKEAAEMKGPGKVDTRPWTEVPDAINSSAFKYVAIVKWAVFCAFLLNVLVIGWYLVETRRQ